MSEKDLTQTEKIYTVEDYLKFKHRGSTKREFYNGKIFDTAGPSRRHNLIGSNTTIGIGSRLSGQKCKIYVNDMLVKLTNKSFCYPDVVIVKGEPIFDGSELDVLVNPTVIVEISSKASVHQDKTFKLVSYLAMESVKECLLIKEEEMFVEHYAKQTINQWVYKIYNKRDDNISLDSVNCQISLAEIYSQIKFDVTYRSIPSQVEEEFYKLAKNWYRETLHFSNYMEIILHPAYQRIIGLGKGVIPFILRELQDEPLEWFWALRALTGEDPTTAEMSGKRDEMAKAWLDWGKEQEFI